MSLGWDSNPESPECKVHIFPRTQYARYSRMLDWIKTLDVICVECIKQFLNTVNIIILNISGDLLQTCHQKQEGDRSLKHWQLFGFFLHCKARAQTDPLWNFINLITLVRAAETRTWDTTRKARIIVYILYTNTTLPSNINPFHSCNKHCPFFSLHSSAFINTVRRRSSIKVKFSEAWK
jgi:hypothetical protein